MLFIPCLIQDVMPEAGLACLHVLRAAGIEPLVPHGQTCCGQPLFKLGHASRVRPLARRVMDLFADAEAVVCPSGSCTHMIRRYPDLFPDDPATAAKARDLAARTYEFTQFLVDVLHATDFGATLPTTAVYHDSCQMGRTLGLTSQPLLLLSRVAGLTLATPELPDACCGFGGPFSMRFPGVSEALTLDKIQAILATRATTVICAEPSCLQNIKGALAHNHTPLQTLHIAQVLATGLGGKGECGG
ncbi:MAG: (Fe-S)-binding protein, partial [Desulfovibrionaceae bacterium]|nr:(Fe-S)-binding protein [Desulfovibrionaceae bacterium]